MDVKLFEAEVLSTERVEELSKFPLVTTKIFENKILVDTAGFVPLDVRIKEFILSGEQSKLSAEMFDSDDWRYMFDHVNGNSLEVGDDIEDVSRKLQTVLNRQNEILSRKALQKSEESNTHDEGDRAKSEAKSEKADGSVKDSGEKD